VGGDWKIGKKSGRLKKEEVVSKAGSLITQRSSINRGPQLEGTKTKTKRRKEEEKGDRGG